MGRYDSYKWTKGQKNWHTPYYNFLDDVGDDMDNTAPKDHDHGGSALLYSVVTDESNLGTGATDGEKRICSSNGNEYIWESSTSKWRVVSGNRYAVASLPSSTTYELEEGTIVYTTDENGNMYSWDDTNSKWRVSDGNRYAVASLPSSTTYTIEEGTVVYTTDENGNSYSWDSTAGKWRVRDGNKYSSDPSSTTYSIETGTMIYNTTDDRRKVWDGSDFNYLEDRWVDVLVLSTIM